MKKIPVILICFRLIAGFFILLFALQNPAHHRHTIVILFTLGLLSDIFDGILARRLGVATPTLRRMDSTVDQFFFLAVAASCLILCIDFFRIQMWPIISLLAMEALIYLVSFIKFRKEVATHSIGAKIWTLFLFATLAQIIWQCNSGILFSICIWLGIATRLEIIAIILLLKQWTIDVPSVYHAILLRKGKEIKRHHWFNG